MNTYTIDLDGEMLSVEVYNINNQDIYLVTFGNEIMTISQQRRLSGELYWHSTPQKFQGIAQEIGKRIESHLKEQGKWKELDQRKQ